MMWLTRRRHLRKLTGGVSAWNDWRAEKEVKPELAGATLRGADLRDANLAGADLRGSDLTEADLTGANLWRADLEEANLEGASLRNACLDNASLVRAKVSNADFTEALFRETRWTDLSGAVGVEPLVGPDAGAPPRYAADERPTGELAHRVVAPRLTAPVVEHPGTPAAPDGLCLFVSYTGKDDETAQALIAAFEAAGHVCWDYLSDPVQETEQDEFTAELIGRLLGSDALVVLNSPRSATRAWVGHEIDVADRHAKRRVFVVMQPTKYDTSDREAEEWGHFVMLDARSLDDTARRAVGVLRDERRWGSAQRLGPSR